MLIIPMVAEIGLTILCTSILKCTMRCCCCCCCCCFFLKYDVIWWKRVNQKHTKSNCYVKPWWIVSKGSCHTTCILWHSSLDILEIIFCLKFELFPILQLCAMHDLLFHTGFTIQCMLDLLDVAIRFVISPSKIKTSTRKIVDWFRLRNPHHFLHYVYKLIQNLWHGRSLLIHCIADNGKHTPTATSDCFMDYQSIFMTDIDR